MDPATKLSLVSCLSEQGIASSMEPQLPFIKLIRPSSLCRVRISFWFCCCSWWWCCCCSCRWCCCCWWCWCSRNELIVVPPFKALMLTPLPEQSGVVSNCCSRGIVLDKNSNFHTCSRCSCSLVLVLVMVFVSGFVMEPSSFVLGLSARQHPQLTKRQNRCHHFRVLVLVLSPTPAPPTKAPTLCSALALLARGSRLSLGCAERVCGWSPIRRFDGGLGCSCCYCSFAGS